jgi:hypothetical protein
MIPLSSCASQPEELISIEKEDLNNQVLLRAPTYANSFKPDHPIILEVKNATNQVIIFPRNFNLHIFSYEQNKWVQIEEQDVVRLPNEDIALSPSTKIIQALSVFPKYPNSTKSYRLRIYVIGNLNDENKKTVAAYIEVKVKP